MIVKSIRVLSLAKIMGMTYATLGLIFGLIFSLVSVLGVAVGSIAESANGNPGALVGTVFGLLFGIGAVLILPILYGTMGFLAGLVVSAIYNFAARTIGGLELEVEAE